MTGAILVEHNAIRRIICACDVSYYIMHEQNWPLFFIDSAQKRIKKHCWLFPKNQQIKAKYIWLNKYNFLIGRLNWNWKLNLFYVMPARYINIRNEDRFKTSLIQQDSYVCFYIHTIGSTNSQSILQNKQFNCPLDHLSNERCSHSPLPGLDVSEKKTIFQCIWNSIMKLRKLYLFEWHWISEGASASWHSDNNGIFSFWKFWCRQIVSRMFTWVAFTRWSIDGIAH